MGAEEDKRAPQLTAKQKKRDRDIRALACGIPYEQIGKTRLIELERRWRAKELEVSMYARVHVELKMLDVSARQLGEAEEPELETDTERRKEQAEEAKKHKRWEALGQPIKAKLREDILFSLQPEHIQAAQVYLHGWPDKQDDAEPVIVPLEGMSKSAAKAMLALIRAKTFTYGAWADSELWRQLRADDGLARKRLEALAEG